VQSEVLLVCGNVGHLGSGGDDPAEPGYRGDGQQHAGDLVLGRARRQRPPGTPFQAHPRRPGGHACPYPQQRRGLGIQSRRPGWIKPEPGLVFDEAFVDHRQPAQNLLESHRLTQIAHPPSRHHDTSCRSGFHPPDGMKDRESSLQEAELTGPGDGLAA
jgi:hypothetical protein